LLCSELRIAVRVFSGSSPVPPRWAMTNGVAPAITHDAHKDNTAVARRTVERESHPENIKGKNCMVV